VKTRTAGVAQVLQLAAALWHKDGLWSQAKVYAHAYAISDCPYQSSRGKGFLVYLCHAGYHYFNTEFATHLLPTCLAYAAALLCIG
jgi:hypothetical protein